MDSKACIGLFPLPHPELCMLSFFILDFERPITPDLHRRNSSLLHECVNYTSGGLCVRSFNIHGLINHRSCRLKTELGSCSEWKNWKVSARDSASALLSPYCQSPVERVHLNLLVSSGTAQWHSFSMKGATALSLRFRKMSPTLPGPFVWPKEKCLSGRCVT